MTHTSEQSHILSIFEETLVSPTFLPFFFAFQMLNASWYNEKDWCVHFQSQKLVHILIVQFFTLHTFVTLPSLLAMSRIPHIPYSHSSHQISHFSHSPHSPQSSHQSHISRIAYVTPVRPPLIAFTPAIRCSHIHKWYIMSLIRSYLINLTSAH